MTLNDKSWEDWKGMGTKEYQNGSYEEALTYFQTSFHSCPTYEIKERQRLLSNIVACRLKCNTHDVSLAIQEAQQVRTIQIIYISLYIFVRWINISLFVCLLK